MNGSPAVDLSRRSVFSFGVGVCARTRLDWSAFLATMHCVTLLECLAVQRAARVDVVHRKCSAGRGRHAHSRLPCSGSDQFSPASVFGCRHEGGQPNSRAIILASAKRTRVVFGQGAYSCCLRLRGRHFCATAFCHDLGLAPCLGVRPPSVHAPAPSFRRGSSAGGHIASSFAVLSTQNQHHRYLHPHIK